MIKFMKEILDKLLSVILSQLPYLGYLNYFVPVRTFLKIGTAWLAAIALFYLYSVLARWIKLIE